MKKALFPGTFDPPTLGHLNIIKRACTFCECLYVGVANNTQKTNAIFSVDERVEMLREVTKSLSQVKVTSFPGLVVDYALSHGMDALIRSLRTSSDLDYEFAMALANRRIGDIETNFLMAGEGLGHISSTLIKEIARNGRRLDAFVPKEIEEKVFRRLTSAL